MIRGTILALALISIMGCGSRSAGGSIALGRGSSASVGRETAKVTDVGMILINNQLVGQCGPGQIVTFTVDVGKIHLGTIE